MSQPEFDKEPYALHYNTGPSPAFLWGSRLNSDAFKGTACLYDLANIDRGNHTKSDVLVHKGIQEVYHVASHRVLIAVTSAPRKALLSPTLGDALDHDSTLPAYVREALALGQEWLSNCSRSHRMCQAWQDGSSCLPSRVLDVGSMDGSQTPYLRLSSGEIADYVCLSHRWGGSETLTTTAATLTQRMNGIPLETMPKTFKDAVMVTQALGFRYLWIDSLCILQDDAEDWRSESAIMGDIYRNARLTIVAAAAKNLNSGCFQDAEEARLTAAQSKPCRVGTYKLNHSCSVHEWHEMDVFAHHRERQHDEGGHNTLRPPNTLDSRAWVLQEELLSARMLVFAEDGVHWECAELTASDGFPAGDPDVRRASLPLVMGGLLENPQVSRTGKTYLINAEIGYARSFKLEILGRSPPDRPKVFDQAEFGHQIVPMAYLGETGQTSSRIQIKAWTDIVENYSSRDLTYETDRFSAIDGVVRLIKKLTGSTAVHGLWTTCLPQQLLWQVCDYKKTYDYGCGCEGDEGFKRGMSFLPRRPTNNPLQAPSWSWASVNAPVRYFPEECSCYFIFTPSIELRDDARNLPDRLILHGLVKTVRAKVKRQSFEERMRGVPHEFVGSICDPRTGTSLGILLGDMDRELDILAVCLPVTANLPSPLLSAAMRKGRKGRKLEGKIYCLILEPTDNCRLKNSSSDRLEFRRIGIAVVMTNNNDAIGLVDNYGERLVMVEVI